MFGVAPEEVTDEERRQAKAVNFGAAYGSGPQGLVNYFQSIGQLISLGKARHFSKPGLMRSHASPHGTTSAIW